MAELFSEIYNCYFQVVKTLIESNRAISLSEAEHRIKSMGFEESVFYLLPKLTGDEWGFFETRDNKLISRLSPDFFLPFSNLQKAYIKSILLDEKMKLFLTEKEISHIEALLEDVEPLYNPDYFYYTDRFCDGDDFSSPNYRRFFQSLLASIKEQRYVKISYASPNGSPTTHRCIPCRLEYSVKNDRFRLLAVDKTKRGTFRLLQLNLERISDITLTEYMQKKKINLSHIIKRSYYKKPVKLIIKNERNALERAMLQFANYEKHTRKIGDNIYECLIYYNKSVETELLIEVLSFGPMIQVVGNEEFLNQLKERLKCQMLLEKKTKS